ncbi:MAG TPA: hypothetical protein VII95_20365 [Terriglobales bacterium]
MTALIPLCHSRRAPGSAVLAEVNEPMMEMEPTGEERTFAELRRKIREAELLSAATEKLLRNLRFSGRLSVVVKNGCILKSGYEEGYFSRQQDERMIP